MDIKENIKRLAKEKSTSELEEILLNAEDYTAEAIKIYNAEYYRREDARYDNFTFELYNSVPEKEK